MHELALMAELQRLAEQEALLAGARRIHQLRLRLGALAGVDAGALHQAFTVLATSADAQELWQGAQLELEHVPAGRELALVALEVS